MRHPGFGLSTEIRVVSVKEGVSPDEVLCLHQPARFADQNTKRIPGLRGSEGVMAEVGIGWGGTPKVYENESDRVATVPTYQWTTPSQSSASNS